MNFSKIRKYCLRYVKEGKKIFSIVLNDINNGMLNFWSREEGKESSLEIKQKEYTFLDKFFFKAKTKHSKIVGGIIAAMMLFTTFTPILATSIPATTEQVQQEKTDEQSEEQQTTGLTEEQVTKSIEEVLSDTEQNAKPNTNAPPVVMTEERAKQSNLVVIGTTAEGNKIWASAPKEIVKNFVANPRQGRSVGNSSGMLTWMGVYSTPMIWLDGVGWVFCIMPYEAFPSGNWYDDGTWINDLGLKAILLWGFPGNFGGQHGLSDQEAYLRTFVAINAYLGNYNRSTVESYEDGYVNLLLQKGDSQDIPNETYRINNPSSLDSHFNSTMNWLETDGYEVTGGTGNFWPENLPVGFKMSDSNNNIVSSLPIGSWFKIVTTDLAYTGTINFDIKTDLSTTGAIKFSSAGVQDLVSLKARDPLQSLGTSANFKAATGNVVIPKTHQNTSIQTYPYDFSKYTVEAFNKEGVSVGTTTVESDGFAKFNDLLLGDYTYTETINDNGIVAVKGTGTFTIIPGETIELTSANGLINRPAVGKAKFSKLFNNATQESYPVRYSDYGVNISGSGVNKDYWLSDANYLETDNLLVNKPYTYNEIVRNDKGSVKVVSTGTFTLTADGQMIDLTTGKIVNEAAYVDIEYTKRDAEWTTPIFKPSTFAIYDYDTTTGVIGNKIAESSTNFLSAKGKFSKILVGYSGNRTIILKELVAPDGYFKDEKGIVIHLTTAQHKQTIEIDYYNVPEHITSLEVIKTNHKNVVMANVPFKLERINGLGGDVLELIETLKTNADGFTRFMNVPSNDQDNNAICYRATELRTEENKYYILDKPFEFCGDKNVKIVKYTAVNEPKQLKAPIHKRAEANPVGITSDGSVWGLYNNKDEVIKEVTIQNNFAEATNLTFENTTPGMYWQELATGNDALEIDPNKYYLDAIDWMNIEDGDTLEIPGNTAENPLINKIKMIGISGFKANEYLQKLLGVQFSIFAEDEVIVKEDTGEEEIVQKKVADLLTNEAGEFKSELYPIYLFDSLNLDYLQEIATLEQLVIITKKYEIPTIAAVDYAKYKTGDYIEMFSSTDPLINYNLRLTLALAKANEDKEMLPLTKYGLFDENKKQLATGFTDADGVLYLTNIRFDIFVNEEEPTAKKVPVYIGELQTADEKYALDYTPYFLPNLYGQEADYEMNDVIWLSTVDEPIINNYVRGEKINALKTDDSGENNIAKVPFLFTRTTGDAVEGIETVTDENRAAVYEKYKQLPNNRIVKPEGTRIDSQDQFLVYTDEAGKIAIEKELALYGDWIVDEMEAPTGYQDLIDVPLEAKQLKFTITEENQVVNLHFYNTLKAVELAVTGSNTTTLAIVLGIEILLVSGILLWFARKRLGKNTKVAVSVLLMAISLSIGAGGTVLTAATPGAPISVTDKVLNNEQPKSVLPYFIDPIGEGGGGEEDPVDRVTPPTPPATEIEGEKPVVTPPQTGASEPGTETETEADDTVYQETTDGDYLPSAGEQNLEYAVVGTTVVLIGLLVSMIARYGTRKRRDSKQI